ncbi:hypothetical protein LFX15_18695 [Leptospira levettii]|uniref:hypothetical protein n=1 Tax=Leptospira levettii TaxID=2023178 RepID=UPI001EEB199D|nr:hypothetical protein [Leptospira levettii]MCG6150333.1 hypothetical protein [Leptospira levettii]
MKVNLAGNLSLIILFLSISQFFAIHGESPRRLYIQGISTRTDPKIALQAQAGLLEGLTAESKNLIVLDDDALAALLKQAGLALSFNSDKDGFILQISKSPYKPDFLVYADFQFLNSVYFFQITLLEITELGSYRVKKTVNFTCENFQIVYFSREAAKALLNPEHKIDTDKAPRIERIVPITIALSDTQNLTASKPNLESIDSDKELLNSLIEYVNDADFKFQERKYLEAESIYEKVIQSLEILRPETKARIEKFYNSVVLRRRNAIAAIWKIKIDSINQKYSLKERFIDRELVKSLIEEYNLLITEWLKFPNSLKDSKINTALLQSNQSLQDAKIKLCIQNVDEKVVNKEFDLAFNLAQECYNESLKIDENFLINKILLTSFIEKRMKEVQSLGKTYLTKKVDILLNIAEKENSLCLIERKMGHTDLAKRKKEFSISALEEARKTLTNTNLIDPVFINNYNDIVSIINNDQEMEIGLKTIALIPFYYVQNIFYALTNIFVFRPASGLEIGAEIGFIGTDLGFSKSYDTELSSGWNEYSPLTNRQRKHLLTEYSWGFLIVGQNGPCTNFVFYRNCFYELQSEDKWILTKNYMNTKIKNEAAPIDHYTTIRFNAVVGYGGNLTIETHRFLELFGVLIFQDWDIYNSKFERQKYLRSKRATKL